MQDKNTQTPEKVEMKKVKLAGPHTHQRKDYKRGDELGLRKDQADRLIKAQRAVAV